METEVTTSTWNSGNLFSCVLGYIISGEQRTLPWFLDPFFHPFIWSTDICRGHPKHVFLTTRELLTGGCEVRGYQISCLKRSGYTGQSGERSFRDRQTSECRWQLSWVLGRTSITTLNDGSFPGRQMWNVNYNYRHMQGSHCDKHEGQYCQGREKTLWSFR